jgi:hypothetical protein
MGLYLMELRGTGVVFNSLSQVLSLVFLPH